MPESGWKICGKVYGRLVAESGLPGADVLSCGSRVRQLLWLAAIATLTYYTVAEMTAIMREYFNYNVAVAIEYNTNDTLEFPDVTICNVNPFRKGLLCAALDVNSHGMDPGLKARLCGDGQTFKDVSGSVPSLRGGVAAFCHAVFFKVAQNAARINDCCHLKLASPQNTAN